MIIVLAAIGWWPPSPAVAGIVDCTVNCLCTATASEVAFGTFSPLGGGSAADTAGQVQVTCNLTDPDAFPNGTNVRFNYAVSLSGGQSGNVADRRLGSLGTQTRYDLYLNSARTTVWGDGTGGSSTIQGSILIPASNPTPKTDTHAVYARIPAGQQLATPGFFVDNIVVTVSW